MLCVAIGTAVVAPPVLVHKYDRHVAKVETRVAVKKAVAKVRRERPAFRVKREAIVSNGFSAPPVWAEAAAKCVPSGGLSGGGAGGGGGAVGYIGIGGGAIGIGHTPQPGGGAIPAVPEPSSYMLMMLGVGVLGGAMRSNRKTRGRVE